MTRDQAAAVAEVCKECGNDRSRLLDIVTSLQARHGWVSARAMDIVARALGIHRVEVEGVVSFYSFLSGRPRGEVVIRLSNDVIDAMAGSEAVARALREELGIEFGETTPDGRITLEETSCIGMCDQAPAALAGGVVFTELTAERARALVAGLRAGREPQDLVTRLGDGNNAHELVRSMVVNNIRKSGPVVLESVDEGRPLCKALGMTPQEVIRSVKTSRLRGRGGAGFPTGIKWELTRAAPGDRKVVICNADEGEPGTFKDRVILTERPELMIEGMTIAAYAIGADTGILYLRAEYAYLRRYLEHVLERRRHAGLLGRSIQGREGFDFDLRIQIGAGAYVCGEETALINSCQGRRGDPRNRPPFPAQKGYLGRPTSVNNVETFCCVARILQRGAPWFAQLGSRGSPGTKLLSISGDCPRPGVYEVEFGTPLAEVLHLAGAEDAAAVQVGGPSGRMVGPEDYEQALCYDHLATGGSIMVFGPDRDILEVASRFLKFFVHESCGYCTPCRVGNVLLEARLARIRAGRGEAEDLDYLESLARTIKTASRCGLGQSSPNPVLSTLEKFRPLYEKRLARNPERLDLGFDLAAAVSEAESIAGRASVHTAKEQAQP